jgi:hypothetical protein
MTGMKYLKRQNRFFIIKETALLSACLVDFLDDEKGMSLRIILAHSIFAKLLKTDIADSQSKHFRSPIWVSTAKKIYTSNRSTNAKAARLLLTSKALASVLLSDGGLRHCA